MPVIAMHGIAENVNSKLFQYRNIIEKDKFIFWLNKLPENCISLSEYISKKNGTVITIDDSTIASFWAAKTAKMKGHEVTFFINPYYIVNQLPYFFSAINLILDYTQKTEIIYKGIKHDITDYRNKNNFRKILKSEYLLLKNNDECYEYLDKLKYIFEIGKINYPNHLKIISIEELKELKDIGVNIENHSWSHISFNNLSNKEIQSEVQKAEKWILETLNHKTSYLALPFGNYCNLHQFQNYKFYFLDTKLKILTTDYEFNRKDLTEILI